MYTGTYCIQPNTRWVGAVCFQAYVIDYLDISCLSGVNIFHKNIIVIEQKYIFLYKMETYSYGQYDYDVADGSGAILWVWCTFTF